MACLGERNANGQNFHKGNSRMRLTGQLMQQKTTFTRAIEEVKKGDSKVFPDRCRVPQ